MTRTHAAGAAGGLSVVALIAMLFALFAAAPATAARARARPRGTAVTKRIIKECTRSSTGLLKNRYSVRVLRQALKQVSGDVAEYTGCTDAIKAQLRRSKSNVIAGVRTRAGGPLTAGSVTLLFKGKVVDTLAVRRGKSATFKVQAGSYAVRANGNRRCTLRVSVRARRTVRAAVLCR